MPCIFCVAVFTALAGQVTAAVVDQLTSRLQAKATGPVRTTADTDSVLKLECDVPVNGKAVPVAVTIMKEAKRVRIQVLTHEIAREDAEKLQNLLADAMDLRVIERSDPESEGKVRDAFAHQLEGEGRTAVTGTRADPPPDKKRSRWPFGR